MKRPIEDGVNEAKTESLERMAKEKGLKIKRVKLAKPDPSGLRGFVTRKLRQEADMTPFAERLDGLEGELRRVDVAHRLIGDLKVKVATLPTRGEFKAVKGQIDKLAGGPLTHISDDVHELKGRLAKLESESTQDLRTIRSAKDQVDSLEQAYDKLEQKVAHSVSTERAGKSDDTIENLQRLVGNYGREISELDAFTDILDDRIDKLEKQQPSTITLFNLIHTRHEQVIGRIDLLAARMAKIEDRAIADRQRVHVSDPTEQAKPKVKFERWFNLYPNGSTRAYFTKDLADAADKLDVAKRIECHKIEWWA